MTSPLSQYYRAPGGTVELPTKGKFTNQTVLKLDADGSVQIYPMGAKDELIINNPDHLLSGSAIKQIIHSCCPNVVDAGKLSVIDADVIVLAIKKATYGQSMDITASCPQCKKLNEFKLDIDTLIASATPITNDGQLRIDDNLVLYVRPYTLDQQNKIGMKAFEETIAMKSFLDQTLSESEKVDMFTKSFERMSDLNIDVLSESLYAASLPTGMITDENELKEFVLNTSSAIVNKIKEKLKELNNAGLPESIEAQCLNTECNHIWQAPMSYDPSTFFGSGS